MLLEEFDVEKYERTIKKEGYEEGHAEGRASGLREGHASGLREGREEGHASGLQEGRASDVLTILEQKGTVPADLRERILSQRDEAILKKWLLTAASVEDIMTFREKTGSA